MALRPARALVLSSAVLSALSAWIAGPVFAAAPGTNVLVSRPAAFGPLSPPLTNNSTVSEVGQGGSRIVSDADGHRYVVFESHADGLSTADDDQVANVYVRDRTLGITSLVSRADGPGGAGANSDSTSPSISADGRWVAFQSAATNLAPGVSGAAEHIYVRDLLNGSTRLIDRFDGVDGAVANNDSFDPAITVVGGQSVVAFTSVANNLDGATGGFAQVYVREEGPADTTMVSQRNGLSVAGNGSSSNPSISTNGAVVAFQSAASDLVAGDSNSNDDVFTRTPATSATLIASGGNGDSRNPSISADGDEVAFTSTSTNLQANDTDPGEDVYARQFSTVTLRLVSRADGALGVKGNQPSSQPSINDAGSVLAFTSAADNLLGAGADTNATADVFLRSGVFAANPSTIIVSRPLTASPAVESDGPSTSPSISRNPSNSTNLIAFETAADNMGADDENDFTQVYGRHFGLVVGPNPAIYFSRPSGADPFRSGVNASYLRAPQRSNENVASMSQDGRFTVFLSAEDDLSSEDDDRFFNVYRRDNLTGETLLVSRADGAAGAAANGTSAVAGGVLSSAPFGAPSISADGNRIAFPSAATNLVGDDSNGVPDVFVRDVAAGSTVLASRQANGAVIPVFSSGDPALSGDGNRVAFVTRFAGDALDGNNDPDVYVRDLAAATTQLVSRKGPAGPAGNDASSEPAIDANGSHIAFTTSADDFSAIPDLNTASDVWVRDVAAGQVALVSRAASSNTTAEDGSFAPAISADGNRIAFASNAANVVAGVDVNGGVRDVFLRDMGTATTSLVSATAGANGISGNGGSERPSIDAAGTRVAFETAATDLVPGDANGRLDVLLRDTTALTTELVSRGAGPDGAQAAVGSGTASISGNGDCVAFETTADAFVAMPAGTDHTRVLARALRGDCPFGPLAAAPGAPPASPDTTPPVLSRVSIAPRRFLAGRRVRPRTRTRPAIGGRLRFTLSEAASVTIRIDALLPGRRLRGRCVPPRRAPRGRVCTRAIRRGVLTRAGTQGANRVAITGRLRGKRLRPGPYRATLRAKDVAGNVSAARRVTFRILRPR